MKTKYLSPPSNARTSITAFGHTQPANGEDYSDHQDITSDDIPF